MEKQRVVPTLNKTLKTCLEGHGFKKIKHSDPFYVKVINGKIIQGINYRFEKAWYTSEYEKGVSIFCGITTIYDPYLDYSCSYVSNDPFNINYREPLLIPTYYTYKQDASKLCREVNGPNWNNSGRPLYTGIVSELDGTLENALNAINNKIMPVFNQVKTLKDYVDFYEKYYNYDLYAFFIHRNSSGIPVLMEKYPNLWDYMEKFSDEEYEKLKASLCEEANSNIEREKKQLEIISEKLSDEEYERLKASLRKEENGYNERMKEELELFLEKRRKAFIRIEDITRPGSTELQKEIEVNEERAKRYIEAFRKEGVEI